MQALETQNTQTQTDVESENFRLFDTEDGHVPFLKDIWGFFGKKGVKTRFFSVNSDASYKVDIEICESLGCPVYIVTDSVLTENKWEIIKSTLKERKLPAEHADKAWLQGLEKKWILPKNIIVKGTPIAWKTIHDEISAVPENRCDILKVEGSADNEHMILASILAYGYRPGVLLVRYTEDPDANVPSMMTAGQLHMAGYKLVEVTEKWFLYIYTDVCLYESVSMRNKKVQNPVVQYLAELLAPPKKASTEAKSEMKEEEKQTSE